MPAVQFISDLHLDAARPRTTRLFLHYLATRARGAEAVYILGDLFDAWIGDDDDAPLPREVASALRACTAAGTAVWLQRGNRDFLLGGDFAAASGARLLDDPAVIDLFGRAALLTHGDRLCTRDTDYQALRRRVRSARWRDAFLAQPLDERRRQGAGFREASRTAGLEKPGEITDVEPAAVAGAMRRHGVYLLIHGHTHRRAVHRFDLDGREAVRIVLGSWDAGCHPLVFTPEGFAFERLGPGERDQRPSERLV